MAGLTAADFEAAKARGNARRRGPRAESSHYDASRNRITVRPAAAVGFGLAPGDAAGLRGASTAGLKVIEVEPFGPGIQFPRLDVDLYVPALLQGVIAPRRWTASRLGAEGGQARSAANAAASRATGKRGPRPQLAGAADDG